MMARVLTLYHTPADATAFDDYYFSKHVPLAKQLPGLRAYRTSHGPVLAPDGSRPYHLVAELEFDSADAIQKALASPQGQQVVADLDNFASAGVTLMAYETRDA
jgi:uncharacterized protein (TIGR02118 family)